MRLFNLLLLCLLLPLFASAQYRTEFGLDLTSMIILASGNAASPSTLEIIYKEDTGDKDLRFKFIITSAYNKYELVRRVDFDSLQYFNYAIPTHSYGINIGVAPKFKAKDLNLYYGFDLHFALNKASTAVMTAECNPLENIPLCEQLKTLDNTYYTLGLIPFLGGKFNITERIVLTVEFGTELAFFLGHRNYYAGDNQVRKEKLNFFEPQFNRWLNDIALTYRF